MFSVPSPPRPLSKVKSCFPPKGASVLPTAQHHTPPILPCLFYRHILQRKRRRKRDGEETKESGWLSSGTKEKEMKGTSKVIMGATLVMVVILALVIGLILVLLAELYCSLLLRRRQLRNTNSISVLNATTQTTTTKANGSSSSHSRLQYPSQHPPPPPPPPPPFSSIYAQGVLQAPRSFLLPAVATKEDIEDAGSMKLHSLLHHQIVQIQSQEPNASPNHVGVLSSSSSPPAPFISKAPPKPSQEDPLQGINSGGTPCCNGGEYLVYISNPIYENGEGKASGANTPFQTPDTSPSRLERGGSSEEEREDEEAAVHSSSYTPPLTPMKKLPAQACSVSLRDARSLDHSASDSRSINEPSSSSSGSPCTSPSW